MLDAGIVVRGVGESMLWCPPLTITDDEVGTYIEALGNVLSAA